MNIKQIVIKITIIIIIGSCLNSCIPEPIPIVNLPQIEQAMILSNVSFDNENFELPIDAQTFFVTKSFSLFGFTPAVGSTYSAEDIKKIAYADLDIKLTNLGSNIVKSMNYDNQYGVYFFNNQDDFLVDNVKYQITINDNNSKKKFEATSTYLPSVGLEKICIDTKPQSKPDEFFIEIHFEIKDFENQKNYYLISARRVSSDTSISEELIETQGDFLPIDDSELFDGYIKTSFLVAKPRLDFFDGDRIIIGLSHISKEYFEYLKEYKKRSQAFGFVSEPYNIKSNISGNGLGFFSLHRTTLKTQVLDIKNKCK